MNHLEGKGKISFVVPVFNGELMLEKLCDEITLVGTTIDSFDEYEIILVDDGSTDDSCEVGRSLQMQRPEICFVELSRNFGQHNATLAGMSKASGEVIVTLDQDLQHPPKEVPRLVEKLNEGLDVVYGLSEKRPHSLFRNLSSDFSKWLASKTLKTALGGNFSSFRVIQSWVAKEILQYNSSYVFVDGFISWTTQNVGGVEVANPQSEYESRFTFFKLIKHGLNLLVNFSIRPLQIASLAGFFSAFVGLILAAYIVYNKLVFGEPVQGWTSLLVMILVVGGAQIAFLGLIGEYVGRILMNTNRAPTYVIRNVPQERRSNEP